MPIQVHIISNSPEKMEDRDKDTLKMQDQFNQINEEISKWPQFQVHFYDKLKRQSQGNKKLALAKLKQDCILRIPHDIDSMCYSHNKDLRKYQHNATLTNATQSQQYIMDIIDQKFEKLKEQVYKLGIAPV